MAGRIAARSGGLVRVAGLVEGAWRTPGIVRTAGRGRTGRGRRRGRCGGRGGGSELGSELGRETACVETCKTCWVGDRLEERIFAGDNLGFDALQQRELAACARHACAHVTGPLHQQHHVFPRRFQKPGLYYIYRRA